MNNEDKKFYTISLIVMLIGIVIGLLIELTGFGKGLMYFVFTAVVIPLIIFIDLGIKTIRNNLKK